MRNIAAVLIVMLSIAMVSARSAQPKPKLNSVKGAGGVEVKFKGSTTLTADGTASALVRSDDPASQTKKPREATYVDYAKMEYYQMAILPSGDTVTTLAPFAYDEKLTIARTEKFLGYDCTVATTSVNSNSIEIWYADFGAIKGSPMPSWGVPKGLVLKVMRNGRPYFEAESVSKTKVTAPLLPASWGRILDAADYRYELNNSVVRTVSVFDNDRISFTGAKAPDTFDKDEYLYSVGGGTVILKRVKLPTDIDGQSIFATVSQYSDGDAYDRTGSVFVVPVGKERSYLDAMSSRGLKSVPAFVAGDTLHFPALVSTPDYDVPVELMRFFTTFGVRGFNHIKVKGQNWADSVVYRADVTTLAPVLRGEVWIGAYIGNWDARGHKLSLKITYHPDGRSSTLGNVVVPLFNTVNLLEQAGQTYPTLFDRDSLRVTFRLDKPITDAKLVYLSTGHGGWSGGDEFNRKLNTIRLDGAKVASFIPWRDDCGSYRNLNPASGNFSNGLSSSDLSRSNWCPGMITTPEYIPLGNLDSGQHTISVAIPLGKPENGSFSYWCVSGYLVGEVK